MLFFVGVELLRIASTINVVWLGVFACDNLRKIYFVFARHEKNFLFDQPAIPLQFSSRSYGASGGPRPIPLL